MVEPRRVKTVEGVAPRQRSPAKGGYDLSGEEESRHRLEDRRA